jgi:hypothetical protein
MSSEYVHVKIEFAYSQVESKIIEVRADKDVFDLVEKIGYGKHMNLLFDGKSIDIKTSLAESKLIPNDSKNPHIVKCVMRIGGRPTIPLISVKVDGNKMTTDWNERPHRSVTEVCHYFSTADAIKVSFFYEPRSYRLDSDSITLKNVTLAEWDQESKTFIPIEDCQISVQIPKDEQKSGKINVYLIPKQPLIQQVYYGVLLNQPEKMTDYLQLKNPYYGPGVADSSEAFSTKWRDDFGGSSRYVFMLGGDSSLAL